MDDKKEIDEIKLEGTITDDAPLEVLDYENPILRVTSRKVTHLDDDLANTISDMVKTMLAFEGLGLAAPQIGLNKRVFVFVPDPSQLDEEDGEIEVKIIINPQIVEREGEYVSYEGCLSYPDHVALVNRSVKVRVKYQDLEMNKVEEEFQGMAARAFQHELDHLDGILFIDRMEPDSLKHVDELREEPDDETETSEAREEQST